MNFGDNLKAIRKSKKMSQEELAEKVGVSRQSISKWETGDAYPEMNNILELCKLFHCHINDLVHEDMKDIDSLGEEIKIKAVKFKEEKQNKIKKISKAIYILSKIANTVCCIGIGISILAMIVLPIIVFNSKVENENTLIIFGHEIIEQETEDKIEINNNSIIDKLENNKMILILQGEAILILFITANVFFVISIKHLENLFKNIYSWETPFTLENVEHIKKFTYFLIASYITSGIANLVSDSILQTTSESSFDTTNIIFILCLFCISYIFEYGYEIQKDSTGVMYGNEEEIKNNL